MFISPTNGTKVWPGTAANYNNKGANDMKTQRLNNILNISAGKVFVKYIANDTPVLQSTDSVYNIVNTWIDLGIEWVQPADTIEKIYA